MSLSYQILRPSEHLRPFIRCYLDIKMGGKNHVNTCALPAKTEACIFISTGTAAIVSKQAGSRIDSSGNPYVCKVRGAVAEASLHLDMSDQLGLFAIMFHPTAFYRYFAIPANHISNAYTPAAWVLGKKWEELGLQLRELSCIQQRVQLVETHLMAHCPSDIGTTYLDQAILNAIRTPEKGIQALARESFLCERQFRRQFIQRVGISPARFLSISRINKVLRARQLRPEVSWRSLALEFDYTDASHLLKDMKRLLGLQPSAEQVNEQFLNLQGTNFRVVSK